MTTYCSRPPFCEVVRWDGVIVQSGLTHAEAEDAAICWTGSRVRLQARHNPTNPILAAFREDVADSAPDLNGIAREWLNHLEDAQYALTHLPAHVEHARRVLSHLA